MRQTEKAMKAFHNYIDSLGDKVTEDNINDYAQEFMKQYNENLKLKKEGKLEQSDEEKAYDLYDKAMETYSNSESRRLLKQAIKLKPNFTDAKIELICFYEDEFKRIRELEKLEKEEKEYLESEGYFTEENISCFYGILETRPYIRLLYVMASQYQQIGSYRKAIELYEYIIYLNENDNMGARYSLMGLYAMLEECEKMKEIIDHYPEDNIPTHLFQFVLAYKQTDYTKARRHLRAVQMKVPDFKKFVKGQLDEDDVETHFIEGYYRPFSLEEIIMYMNAFDTIFLNGSLAHFMQKTLK
jgi:hypothetical protein